MLYYEFEYAQAVGKLLTRIEKTLDGVSPLLALPEGKTVDCFGVTKVACVDAAGKITVARDTFQEYGTSARMETAALELFKLLNVPDRYPKARMIAAFVRGQSSTIESHVRFMVEHQLSTFSIRSIGQGEVSLATCVGVGKVIERFGILAELIQILVLEGKMQPPILKSAMNLEDSARALFPYCGINGSEKVTADSSEKVARVETAIDQLKIAIGTPPSNSPPVYMIPQTVKLVKTPKPGLLEGQIFTLRSELDLVEGVTGHYGWNYFSHGLRVEPAHLAKQEGQGFCAINNTDGAFPESLIVNGLRKIPSTVSPLQLTEISQYLNTVFFTGQIPGVGPVGLTVYCGTIQNGDVNANELTSLDAIKNHFHGILEFKSAR